MEWSPELRAVRGLRGLPAPVLGRCLGTPSSAPPPIATPSGCGPGPQPTPRCPLVGSGRGSCSQAHIPLTSRHCPGFLRPHPPAHPAARLGSGDSFPLSRVKSPCRLQLWPLSRHPSRLGQLGRGAAPGGRQGAPEPAAPPVDPSQARRGRSGREPPSLSLSRVGKPWSWGR